MLQRWLPHWGRPGRRVWWRRPRSVSEQTVRHRRNDEDALLRAHETLRVQEDALRRLVPWVIGETEVIGRWPDHGGG